MSIFLYTTKTYISFYLISFLVAIFISVYSYRKLRDELTTLWSYIFIILRTFVFFFILSALFSIILGVRFSRFEKPELYILLDASQSMDEKENTVTRKKQAMSILKDKILPELKTTAKIETFLFSDKLYVPEDSEKINRGVTMLGNALQKTTHIKETPPQAVFLISDGRNNSGDDPIEVASKLPFPVYTIAIGKKTTTNNVKISNVRVNPIVYKGDSVPVNIVITNTGKIRKNLTATLTRKGKTLAKKTVSLLEAGTDTNIKLQFVPEQLGTENIEVNISTYSDEKQKDDNRTNFAVKVYKRRKTIIIIAYELNWDYNFLRNFLISQKDFDVIGFARIKNNLFLIQKGKNEEKGLLNNNVILNADIIVLINPKQIEKTLFSKIIEKVSQKGTGLFIIGNKLPDISIVKKVYPFITSGNIIHTDIEPELTSQGKTSPIFDILKNTSIVLPPLSNPLQIQMAKANAQVLLNGNIGKTNHIPLLGVLNYGKGKIAAISAENLWHWRMLSIPVEGKIDLYANIMNNIIKWLSARKGKNQIIMLSKKTKFLWGEPIIINATIYDELLRPLDGGIITLHLKRGNKLIENFIMDDEGNGNYEKTIANLTPGNYTMQAEVTYPQSIAEKPVLHFHIIPRQIEALDTEPDPALLKNISYLTGGKPLPQGKIQDSINGINLAPKRSVKEKKLDSSQSLTILLLISIIFLTELLLRKLKGLK